MNHYRELPRGTASYYGPVVVTRLRSVQGGTTRDTDHPDSEFVAEVLREHPELIPKPEPHIGLWATLRNSQRWRALRWASPLLIGMLIAFAAAASSMLWQPGSAPANPPTKHQPSHAARPSKPLRHSNPPSGAAVTGADLAPNRLPRPVPRVARSVSPKPAAPSTVVNNSVHPPQQTQAATPAPTATPSPTPTPLLDSIPTPSLPIGGVLNGSPSPTPSPTDPPAPAVAPSSTPPPGMPDNWNPSLPIGWPPPGLTDTPSDAPSPSDPLPVP